MSFEFIITPALEKQLCKINHKNKIFAVAVKKKITQIISLDEQSIEHFKNLRGNLSNYKRVHVGSFVLMFKVEKFEFS